mmetsp:Transcript_10097/g.40798  ORF Transcript_10097/g.40798 Transcript_10097/m.40798 type:complete len:284 (-) Transcript_10097:436-1287(-)
MSTAASTSASVDACDFAISPPPPPAPPAPSSPPGADAEPLIASRYALSHSSLIASSFFFNRVSSVSSFSVSFASSVSAGSSSTNCEPLSHSGCALAGFAAASSSASCSSVRPSVTSKVVSSRLSTLIAIDPPPPDPSPWPPFAPGFAPRFAAALRLALVHSLSEPYCGGVRPRTLANCFNTGAVCRSNLARIAFIPSLVLGSGGAPSSPPPSWTTSPLHTWHVNSPVDGSSSRIASRLEYRLPQTFASLVHLYSTLTGPFSTLYLRSACAAASRSCTASTTRL